MTAEPNPAARRRIQKELSKTVEVPEPAEEVKKEAVPTVAPIRGSLNRRAGKRRWPGVLASFVFFVVIPVLGSAFYFFRVASDQYVATADFAIRSQSIGALSVGGLGMSAGMSNMAAMADALIVEEYINSHQVIEDMKPHLDLRKIYSDPSADWWARLDLNVPDDKLLAYWRSMVVVHFDITTGLTELTVRAFRPEDAKAVADQVLALSEALVNRLSDRSRADALSLAQKEETAAYQRVLKAHDAMLAFSAEAKQIDPLGFAKARSDMQVRLENDILGTESQLIVLRKNLPEEAPGIQRIKNQLAVMQAQLNKEKVESTTVPTGGAMSDKSAAAVLIEFGKLDLERDYAEKAYVSALGSLERCRADTLMQQRYLEAFVRPQLPDYSVYPQRGRSVLLTFLAATLIWAIGSLFISAAKEHL